MIWTGHHRTHIYITSPSANIYEDSKLLQPTPPNIEFQKYIKMYFNFLGIDGTSGEPNLNRPINIKASVTNPKPIITANAGVEGRFSRQIPRCVPIDSAVPIIWGMHHHKMKAEDPKVAYSRIFDGGPTSRERQPARVCHCLPHLEKGSVGYAKALQD
jgi:hypothetical protein